MRVDIQADTSRLEQLAEELKACAGRPRRCLRLMSAIVDWPGKEDTDEHELVSAEIWDRAIGPTLLMLARSGNPRKVRVQALEMLSSSGDEPEVVRLFIDSLYDPESLIRAVAASSVFCLFHGQTPLHAISMQITGRLIELLSDAKCVQENVWYSLGFLARKDTAARRLLLNHLKGPIPSKRSALWYGLMAADEAYDEQPASEQQKYADALVGILMRLSDNRAYACWKAGESLETHIGGEIGLKALEGALRSPYACARVSSIHGLSHYADSRAVQHIQEFAHNDRSDRVRRYANEVLGYLKEKGKLSDKPD